MFRQITQVLTHKLKNQPANGDKLLKNLSAFFKRIEEGRYLLDCKPMADQFADFAEGLKGLRRQHRRGKCYACLLRITIVMALRVPPCPYAHILVRPLNLVITLYVPSRPYTCIRLLKVVMTQTYPPALIASIRTLR